MPKVQPDDLTTKQKIVSVVNIDTGMRYMKEQKGDKVMPMWRSENPLPSSRHYEWLSEETILSSKLFEVTFRTKKTIWKAETGKPYRYLGADTQTRTTTEDGHHGDRELHELGNYFHPDDDVEEILRVGEEIKEVYAQSKVRRAK